MQATDHIALELKQRNSILWCFPGGTICPLLDSMHRYNVQVIVTRSEQGAVFAAIGAYKASGKIQFVAVTSGPGFTNTITGLADAFYDSVPLILLAGQVSTNNLVGTSRQRGFQETPAVRIAQPITKMAVQATSSSNLVNSFKSAIQFATAGRGGPTLVDMPTDCQKGEVE